MLNHTVLITSPFCPRSYPILNIECHTFILPLVGLNKIRDLHFNVMDGRITGEEEIHGVIILIQQVSTIHDANSQQCPQRPELLLPCRNWTGRS